MRCKGWELGESLGLLRWRHVCLWQLKSVFDFADLHLDLNLLGNTTNVLL